MYISMQMVVLIKFYLIGPARKERSPTPRPTKIHVGRLTRNVTKEHVQEIFSAFGTIKVC